MKNVQLNSTERNKMEDEFIITFLNNKKYRIKDVKKIVKDEPKINNKYVSEIDEKICKWKIKW